MIIFISFSLIFWWFFCCNNSDFLNTQKHHVQEHLSLLRPLCQSFLQAVNRDFLFSAVLTFVSGISNALKWLQRSSLGCIWVFFHLNSPAAACQPLCTAPVTCPSPETPEAAACALDKEWWLLRVQNPCFFCTVTAAKNWDISKDSILAPSLSHRVWLQVLLVKNLWGWKSNSRTISSNFTLYEQRMKIK